MRDVSSGRPTLLVLSLLAGAGQAYAAVPSTPVTTCGQVLEAPGNYHLTGNLGPCEGVGVAINSSDVHLILSGFTISGSGCDPSTPSSALRGIFSDTSLENVHIEGGTVRGFLFGIFLGASNSRVNGMTVTDNCGGIIVAGPNDVIDTNVVAGNQSGIGLRGPSNTVHSNHVSGSGTCGVCVWADGNTVRSNIVKDNAGWGIVVSSGFPLTIRGNTISSNAIIGNRDGIFLAPTAARSLLRNNTVHANTNTGVDVARGSRLNTITGNTARANGAADLSDGNNRCVNWWRGNNFGTDLRAGVPDDAGGIGCIN
jgi:parallel beta-helix repeat protein